MKNKLISILVAFSPMLMVGVQAQAQTIEGNVPFAFHAGAKDYAPGRYVVQKKALTSVSSIQNAETGGKIFLGIGIPTLDGPSRARLVFRCYGNQKFLSEIWDGEGPGMRLPVSNLEKQVRETTGANLASTSVTLLAMR